jgi:ABC-2 type transport system ATP-binding protein
MDEADAHAARVVVLYCGKLAAVGPPAELKASLGPGEHTLDDVFIHYAGQALELGDGYRDTATERRTSRRLG